jgi:hypothetical protein
MKKTILIIVILLVVLTTIYCVNINFSGIYKDAKIIAKLSDVNEQILVTFPVKDSVISSPLSITGRARGSWFFEGSFPIILLDAYGNTIAEGYATAQGEWMTNDFVKFTETLQFNNFIKGAKGSILLKKDNPSGLEENDDFIEIPITFK